MNTEPPPLQGADAGAGQPPRQPAGLGALGMRLAYVAPAVFILFLVLRPG